MTGGRPAALLLLLAVLVALTGAGAAVAVPRLAQVGGQGSPDGPRFVELTVGSISPSTVTATTTDFTVRGSLRNTGDRTVTDLDVRLERAPAVATAGDLSTALRVTPEKFISTGAFTRVDNRLNPGESVDFTLDLPTTGRRGSSLALTDPGVYPVLVNVNGTPDFGNTARLDTAHFLLPVQGLPAGTTGTAVTAAAPPELTVLWPFAEPPRLLPVAPGSPALLTDDGLATSLAPGGRLSGLLSAATTATEASADLKGALRASLCLALDPDLLATAEAMAAPSGYLVRTADGGTTAGTGSTAAARWLDRLRSAVTDTCVVALPWGQADLNATARAQLTTQGQIAVTGGVAEVTRVLGVDTVPGLTWPGSGALTTTTAGSLAGLGQSTVLLSADAVTGAAGIALSGTTRAVRVPAGAGTLGVALLDPPASAALAAMGQDPRATDAGPSTNSRVSALQDAIGALSWPSLVRRSPDAADAGAPTSVLLAPPQLWTADAAEAKAVLSTVSGLFSAGLAIPRPLASLVSATGAAPAAQLVYPVRASASELPAQTTDLVGRTAAQVSDFGAATSVDVQARVDPATLTGPLHQDLVRSLSTTTGAPPAGGVADVLATLEAQVQLQTPGGTYTLASESSPLLLVVRNGLPVAVDVRISVTGPPGLAVTDIGVQRLPASSARQLMLPTSVGRTGQFAVDVTLATAGGKSLGPATRVLVRSTAYGTATAAVTGAAGLLLLLLVGRRLWHRFRGEPDPADPRRVLL